MIIDTDKIAEELVKLRESGIMSGHLAIDIDVDVYDFTREASTRLRAYSEHIGHSHECRSVEQAVEWLKSTPAIDIRKQLLQAENRANDLRKKLQEMEAGK